jgi:dihydroorotate dehydrogenase
VEDRDDAERLLEALSPSVDALAMTNSVATQVRDEHGQLLFEGQKRGICGAATRDASLRQLKLFAELSRQRSLKTRMIGVGGAATAAHVRDYLDAGAEAVHIATAAMINPLVALEIRSEFAGNAGLR